MTALEQIREDQALGAAWRRAEAALPEGWRLTLTPNVNDESEYVAVAGRCTPGGPMAADEVSTGSTPTAALEALAEKLGAIRQPAAESATDPGPVLTAYAEDYDRIRDRGDLL